MAYDTSHLLTVGHAKTIYDTIITDINATKNGLSDKIEALAGEPKEEDFKERSKSASAALNGISSVTGIEIVGESGTMTGAWAVVADGSHNLLPYIDDLDITNIGVTVESIGDGAYYIHGKTTGTGNIYLNRGGAFEGVPISSGNGITDRMYLCLNNTIQSGISVTLWSGTSVHTSLDLNTANKSGSIPDAFNGLEIDGIQIYCNATIGSEIDCTIRPVIAVGNSDLTYAEPATITKLNATVNENKGVINSGIPDIVSGNAIVYAYSDATAYSVVVDFTKVISGATEIFPLREKKILVIGDSVSEDAYGNYKKWVTDLEDRGIITSELINNDSIHATGYLATYNSQANTFFDRLSEIADKDTFDMVIVFGGTNDYIQNIPMGVETGDATTEFAAAVKTLFEYAINNFTQARICVISPLRTSATGMNTEGLYETDYYTKIRDIAKEYCLPVLNLTEESGFCPFVNAFKNMWTLLPEGHEAHDGVHPTEEYEAKYLAPLIKSFLESLIR